MRWSPHRPAPFGNETRYASADDHLVVELDRQLLREGHSRPSANFFQTRNSTAASPRAWRLVWAHRSWGREGRGKGRSCVPVVSGCCARRGRRAWRGQAPTSPTGSPTHPVSGETADDPSGSRGYLRPAPRAAHRLNAITAAKTPHHTRKYAGTHRRITATRASASTMPPPAAVISEIALAGLRSILAVYPTRTGKYRHLPIYAAAGTSRHQNEWATVWFHTKSTPSTTVGTC
jgi:hypothetical protein